MKILRENPLLLIWMLILTLLVGVSFFKVKVQVNLHTTPNAKVSVTTHRGNE